MSSQKLKIAVILGSIRKIRRGGRVAKWLMPQLKKYKDAEFDLLDLRDYQLPFYDESNSPEGLEGKYTVPMAKKWAKKIREKDGFVVITPEYNHGPPAVLKNALDYLYPEWNKKPITFISYATGQGSGIRSVEQLRLNSIELQMAPLREALHISQVLKTFDEDGNYLLQGHLSERLEDTINELLWWAKALKKARG